MRTFLLNGLNYFALNLPLSSTDINVSSVGDKHAISYKKDGTVFFTQIKNVPKEPVVIIPLSDEIKVILRNDGIKFRDELVIPANYSALPEEQKTDEFRNYEKDYQESWGGAVIFELI